MSLRPSAKQQPRGLGVLARPVATARAPPLQHAPLCPGVGAMDVARSAGTASSRSTTPLTTSKAVGGVSSAARARGQASPSLRKHIEAYFSDDGLRQDMYLRQLVADSPEGWVDVEDILALKHVKATRARREDVFSALAESWLEIWRDDDGGGALRRPVEMSLPEAGTAKSSTAAAAPRNGASKGAPAPAPSSKAKAAEVKEDATPASGDMLFPGRLTGTISSYDEEASTAAIACAQTQALFQCDVAVGPADLQGFLRRRQGVLNIGTPVSFRVQLRKDGKPTARELELQKGGEDTEQARSAAKKRPWLLDGDEEGLPPATKRAATAQQQPKAEMKKEEPEDEAEEESTGVASKAPAAPKAAAKAKAVIKKIHLLDRRFNGTVKSFNAALGVGRIASKAHATLLAVDKADLSGFVVGDKITFKVDTDEFGTKKAKELEAA
eukprot:TRINITY_DN92685_c0_g1_i1.p1 TRINITY_DN92685_c0_g1~~TRINITY_DN92685_c0_g1_i1.p1  ORF type:complete len:440 (+),score=134.02 TRINITY_DN92685_c0_g1_i1:73-1392(+)